MFLFFLIISIVISFFIVKSIKGKNNKRNKKLVKFKNKLLSKESQIEKIFSRQDEKTSLDPNINIQIDIRENQENIIRKVNIHRARLAKYKKSKLNGQLLFLDPEANIYKIVDGKKVFIT